MIEIEKKWISQIKQILKDHVPDFKALAYGSRVSGRSDKYSDLDIALIGSRKMDWREIEALKDIFSESDIPIIVDIVDYNSASESFRKIIDEHCEVIQR